MLDYGFLYALGTLFIPMLDKFQESRVKIAAVQSTFNGATFISSSLTGIFVSRWGATNGVLVGSILIPTGFFLSFFAKNVFHLYATLCVLAGVGNSFVFVSCCMAVGQAFPDNQRSMALSVQMTVMGVTSIIYPYFLDWLSKMYGVSGTFLIMSGLFLHTFVTAIVFRYEINETNRPEITTPSKDMINDVDNDRKAEHSVIDTKGNACTVKHTPTSRQKNVDNLVPGLRSWSFCLFCVASPLLVGNTTIFITVAQDIFMEKGLSESQSLSGFLIFNVCNTLSRLSPGIFSKFNLSCFVVSLLASLCSVVGLVIVLLSDSYVAVIAGSGCVGAALGGFASSLVSAMFEILGANRQAVGLGIIIAANGITVTGFGPAYGAIRDATGRYNDVLIVTACLNFVCAILITSILLINFIQKRRDQC